jgi:hypothetical protein
LKLKKMDSLNLSICNLLLFWNEKRWEVSSKYLMLLLRQNIERVRYVDFLLLWLLFNVPTDCCVPQM